MRSTVRLGWLAVPAFLAVLTLIGLGVSTESPETFEQRTEDLGPSDVRPPDVDDLPESSPIDGLDGTPRDPGDEPPTDGPPVAGDGVAGGQAEGEGAEVTIVTDTGDIVIQLDEDGRPVRLSPANGDDVEFDPDDLVGIRLGEDGRLEVVPLDEIGPDDTVVVPAEGGFDLLRPDGTRVEFRADGENDGITATEVAPDGTEVELVPNPDGTVTLSDGTTVGPIDVAEDGGAIERLIDRTRDLPWAWVFLALALLAGGSIALALYLHRNRPRDDDYDLGNLVGGHVSEDRFAQFLAGLAADPDPSRAVRIGFSVAERGLGGIPPRRAEETPFEWHQRVEEDHPEAAPAVGVLCDLFARVRFAPGQASDDDRRAMIEHLRSLNGRSSRTGTGVPIEV